MTAARGIRRIPKKISDRSAPRFLRNASKADPTCFRVNIVFFISYKASSFNVIGKFKRERKNRSNWRKFNIIIIKYTLMSLKQILLDKYDLIQ